jgi:hypothetical protein
MEKFEKYVEEYRYHLANARKASREARTLTADNLDSEGTHSWVHIAGLREYAGREAKQAEKYRALVEVEAKKLSTSVLVRVLL